MEIASEQVTSKGGYVFVQWLFTDIYSNKEYFFLFQKFIKLSIIPYLGDFSLKWHPTLELILWISREIAHGKTKQQRTKCMIKISVNKSEERSKSKK